MLRLRLARCLPLLALTWPTAVGAQPMVRPAHPRIWLSADGRRGLRPEVIRARCVAGEGPFARACRAAAPPPRTGTAEPVRGAEQPLINLALRHIIFQEPETLNFVRDLSNQVGPVVDRGDTLGTVLQMAPKVRSLAIAYDWLYPSIAPGDRATMESTLRAWGEWYRTHEPTDVFSSEAFVQASVVGIVGLALAGEAGSEMEARAFLQYAETRWRTVLFPALGHLREGWPEGPGALQQLVAPNALYFTAAWTTATAEDLFTWARTNAGDPFTGWARYASYMLRPDYRFAAFGDATEAQLRPATRLRPMMDMVAWGTGSPLAQTLADEATRRVPTGTDYNGPELWHQLVFYDPGRPSRPNRSELPLGAHLSATALDQVVMRSSWNDDEAVWLSLSCGDFHSPRQHLEAGAIQVYRRAPMIVSTGAFDGFESRHWTGWFSQRSIHSSTIAVHQPDERFATARMNVELNEGGQRAVVYWGDPTRRTLTEYRANLTGGARYETASVTAFETSRFHDYAACDMTRAYNSVASPTEGGRPKVREVTRQLVYLRPELVVLFDRVEATDAAYPKRVVFHGLARPIVIDPDRFVFGRSSVRLLARTLLPANADRAVIEGFRVGDMDFTPLGFPGDETNGARLEVTAPRGNAREYFLHLLNPRSDTRDALPMASVVDEGERVGLRVADPEGQRIYTVMFRRNGMMGGDVRVTGPEGGDLYRGELGAGGTFYAPVADAGVPQVMPDAGGVVDAAVITDRGPSIDGGTGGDDPGDCTCRAGRSSAKGDARLVALLVGATALSRRRRRVF